MYFLFLLPLPLPLLSLGGAVDVGGARTSSKLFSGDRLRLGRGRSNIRISRQDIVPRGGVETIIILFFA